MILLTAVDELWYVMWWYNIWSAWSERVLSTKQWSYWNTVLNNSFWIKSPPEPKYDLKWFKKCTLKGKYSRTNQVAIYEKHVG